LTSGTAVAQSKKDLKKSKAVSFKEIHTKVEDGKEVTVDVLFQKFDSNGEVIEEINYDKLGKVKTSQKYIYNKTGDKIEEHSIGDDGKVKKKKVFKYNAKGDRTEELEYDLSGKLTEKTIFSYNANGDKISAVKMNADDNSVIKKTLFVYDKKGMVIQERVVDNAGKLIEEKRYVIEY
jgi:hypothetical protein